MTDGRDFDLSGVRWDTCDPVGHLLSASLLSGSETRCCTCINLWMVVGDFLELYSICCQIHWDVNNIHVQFCWAIAAVPVQGQLNVTVQLLCWFVR